MSSQASSAGHGEKDVRKKIIETGAVDVMISIRSNVFYTRSVPCELWFFDRAKPKHRRDKVLMLDTRNIYRKVTRKINDFSPEQMQNLSAIIWLYRGQRDRFLALIKQYLGSVCVESAAIADKLATFDVSLQSLRERCAGLKDSVVKSCSLDPEKKKSLTEAVTELDEAVQRKRPRPIAYRSR
jgi:type I restriction enzyme M protein